MSRVPEWFQGQPDPNEAKAKRLTEYVKAAIKLAAAHEQYNIYCPFDPETWSTFNHQLNLANIALDKVGVDLYTWRFCFVSHDDAYPDQNK